MASLLGKLKQAGFTPSVAKTKLWTIQETLETEIDASELDIRVSEYDSKQAYVIVREGDESLIIGFWPGKGLNPEDYAVIDNEVQSGIILKKSLRDVTLSLVIAEAVRDDEELGIKEGDTLPKFIVE